MTEYALGCDVSHWQGEIDFSRMYSAGARFVFIKASQASRMDRRFAANYAMARKTPLLVGAYHYLDWTLPAIEQARYFAKIVPDYPPDLPPVIDYEERNSAPSRGQAISRLVEFIREFEGLTRRTMMTYTSPGYWKEFGLDDSILFASRPLWIAHYRANNPIVPRPWSNWEFWQYTDRGDGVLFGVKSRQIDLDYYHGTEQELLARYGKITQQDEQQPNPPQPVAVVRLQVAAPALNIRQSPTATAARVGQLAQGAVITVEAIHVESHARVWIKHSAGWSAIVYDGQVLLRDIDR